MIVLYAFNEIKGKNIKVTNSLIFVLTALVRCVAVSCLFAHLNLVLLA